MKGRTFYEDDFILWGTLVICIIFLFGLLMLVTPGEKPLMGEVIGVTRMGARNVEVTVKYKDDTEKVQVDSFVCSMYELKDNFKTGDKVHVYLKDGSIFVATKNNLY